MSTLFPIDEEGEHLPEVASGPELWELLSTEGDTLPEAASPHRQVMLSLSADTQEGAVQQVERIRQRLTTKSISLVRVDVNAFKENNIQLSLPDSQKLRASRKHFETLGENHFIWTGKVPHVAASSIFVVRDGNVTGSMRDENNVAYSMEPLGGGLHALTQVDESLLPPPARACSHYPKRPSFDAFSAIHRCSSVEYRQIFALLAPCLAKNSFKTWAF